MANASIYTIDQIRSARETARESELYTFHELEIYPDYCHAWAFLAGDHEDAGMPIGDGCHWFGEPELPYDLIARLASWQRAFENAPFDADLFKFQDWESFHAEGIALATEVKSSLGDRYVVYYAKAFEDRNQTEPKRIVINVAS